MDHEVKYHVHVQTTGTENSKPVNLEEKGLARHGSGSYYTGVEAFKMTYLKDAPRALCNVNQFVGFFYCTRYRLFKQNIVSGFERKASRGRMVRCRNHDADRFHGAKGFFQALEGFDPKLIGQSGCAVLALVVHSCQFRTLNALERVGVPLPVLSHADHGDRHFLQL
jgi:hypothetical protein